ncbi:MAG TPA: PIG-L family deacetylase [Chthoniobacterales bacterium]|nr:PIG-L family deacetylase [Chthoniobacterales bacterium]
MPETPLRILAIGAHPDDLEFGCGGILLGEMARGSEISLCVCSRGEAGSNGTPDEREAEARRGAKLLGATIEFIELGGDAHLALSVANNIAVARQIRTARPDVLLAPVASRDQHPDHVVVSHLCQNAARLARYGGLAELRDLPPHTIRHHLEYAITPGAEPVRDQPTIRIDISEHLARWMELMECHQTQLRTRRYLELQIARARLLGLAAGVEYAQALYATDDLLIRSLAELPVSVRLF